MKNIKVKKLTKEEFEDFILMKKIEDTSLEEITELLLNQSYLVMFWQQAYEQRKEQIERLKEQLNDEIDDELKQSEIMVKKQEEIERLNNIIEKLEERCKFFNEMSNEKQNRIDRCMTFNNYILHENWYGGNEKKYAQRNINILLGKETELKEIPRVGSDKE